MSSSSFPNDGDSNQPSAIHYQEVVPQARGAWLIHDRIVTNLIEADMVLCDMSALNSNVFFELGVRTSLNKPIALVYDGRSDLSFDTSGINTHKYKVPLEYWSMEKHVSELAQHIVDSAESCAGENPLWRQFGLKITAQQPTASESPLEAKLDHLLNRMPRIERLQAENEMLASQLNFRVFDDARRDFSVFPSSNADGNAGLATDAIARYGKANEVALQATQGSDGSVYVTFPSNLDGRHRDRITDLASRYGVVVRMSSPGLTMHEAQELGLAPPTPEEFMAKSDIEDESDSPSS